MRPDRRMISIQLERVLASPLFRQSARLSRFLRFAVSMASEGRQGELKETTVAIEVYKRTADFDPRLDSTVRVEASRLRAKLREYYETEGRLDPLRIEIPKGSYVPVFHAMEAADLRGGIARAWMWLIAAMALILGLALVLAFTRPPDQPSASSLPRPLTTWRGREIQPCAAPGGDAVAMAWSGPKDDNFDIYVLRTGASSPLRLTSDPAAERSPAWSPDGLQIAFLRDAPSGRQIVVVPAAGGIERVVAQVNIPPIMPQPNAPRWIEWTRDGQSLLVSEQDTADRYQITLFSLDGHRTGRLTSPPSGWVGDRDPALSPDGRYLAFTRSSTQVASDIFLLAIGGSEPRRLTFQEQAVRGITWSADGDSLIYSSENASTAGSGSLWRLRNLHSYGEPRVESLGWTGSRAALPSLSRRGGLLVFQDSWQIAGLWRVPTTGGTPEPLISSTRQEISPDYSPDGRHIAFCSNRSGHWEIWRANADGSSASQITRFNGPPAAEPRWSPDSATIAFTHHTADGQTELFSMAADGAALRRLTSHPARDEAPSWARDGQSLYFNSDRSGRWEIWKLTPGAPSQPIQVTRGGGAGPIESPDGRHLYYKRNAFREVWRKPLAGGGETMVFATGPVPSWTIGSQALFFTDPTKGIVSYHWATGRLRTVVASSSDPGGNLKLSPDESTLLFSRRERVSSDLMAVSGFR